LYHRKVSFWNSSITYRYEDGRKVDRKSKKLGAALFGIDSSVLQREQRNGICLL
jgi:hypothetical protein